MAEVPAQKSYKQPILDLSYTLPKDVSPIYHRYPLDHAQILPIKLKFHYAKLLLKTNLHVHKQSKDFQVLGYQNLSLNTFKYMAHHYMKFIINNSRSRKIIQP